MDRQRSQGVVSVDYGALKPLTDLEWAYINLILDDPHMVTPPPDELEYRLMLTVRHAVRKWHGHHVVNEMYGPTCPLCNVMTPSPVDPDPIA